MSERIDLDRESRLALPVSEERDHIRGPADAVVTLVEYGDFECPHCGQAHVVLDRLLDHASDLVRLVYRHFPLIEVHPHAERAAEAAEAAGAERRFWEMHDVLFENQDALDEASLLAYAQDLRLDMARFELEMRRGVYAERVQADLASGLRSGVQGTPTFFINGNRYDGSWDLGSLAAAIEAEIETQGARRDDRTHHARR